MKMTLTSTNQERLFTLKIDREKFTESELWELFGRIQSALCAGGPTVRQDIITCVCAHYRVTRDEIMSRRRMERIVWPRQVAMYLFREMTNDSLEYVGEYFDRDHGTILYACHSVSNRMEVDNEASRDIKKLRREILRRVAQRDQDETDRELQQYEVLRGNKNPDPRRAGLGQRFGYEPAEANRGGGAIGYPMSTIADRNL
jgi:hypothetical protein